MCAILPARQPGASNFIDKAAADPAAVVFGGEQVCPL
jgi:hypothetical protein